MAQYLTHTACFKVLEQILQAAEASGYTRLATYNPGESVLFDSNPAPGYVPGVKGKKETGKEYVPNADGTHINLYYVAGKEPTDKQKVRAQRAAKMGVDLNNLDGRLIGIRRCANGNIQVQFVVRNRDDRDADGKITEKITIDSVSVSANPAKGGGVIVAMALDQSLGIPDHMLTSLKASELQKYQLDPEKVDMFSKDIIARRTVILQDNGGPVLRPQDGLVEKPETVEADEEVK
jgi:hypothetical protein